MRVAHGELPATCNPHAPTSIVVSPYTPTRTPVGPTPVGPTPVTTAHKRSQHVGVKRSRLVHDSGSGAEVEDDVVDDTGSIAWENTPQSPGRSRTSPSQHTTPIPTCPSPSSHRTL